MKQLLFIILCLLATALAVKAQNQMKVSYSGTQYWSNGKLYAKEWVSVANGNLRLRSERPDEQTGQTTITIFRQDSAKFYMLKPANKTAMVLPMSQIQGGMNSMLGLDIEVSRTRKTELLGREMIEGFDCGHYLSTGTSTLTTGTESSGCYEYWLHEPLGVTMQHKEGCGYMPPITLKNFQQGTQPDHLFEIPKDYKVITLPAGGLLEMMTGNSREQNQHDAENLQNEANKQMQDLNRQLENIGNDPNKSDEHKAQDLFKMLEGLNKK